MKIVTLISFYKKCLSDPNRKGRSGFCSYALGDMKIFNKIKKVFCHNGGHYKYWINSNYFFGFLFKPYNWKKRDEFAKKEIVRLQKLLEKGYTHV